jgi:hypothetical protein
MPEERSFATSSFASMTVTVSVWVPRVPLRARMDERALPSESVSLLVSETHSFTSPPTARMRSCCFIWNIPAMNICQTPLLELFASTSLQISRIWSSAQSDDSE